MEIKILNLYSDIMNLYGSSGNIKVLEYHLKELDIPFSISCKSIDDDLDFSLYDLVLIGSGSEDNRMLCLEHLKKYKESIQEAVNNNKFFLITGNSVGLFGKKLYDEDALSIFNYNVTQSEQANSKEVILDNDFGRKIYGFVNNCDNFVSEEQSLFEDEGIKYNNFYGTYVLGPLLARNPDFLKSFLKELFKYKNIDCDTNKIDIELNDKSYDEFIVFKKNKQFNKKHR